MFEVIDFWQYSFLEEIKDRNFKTLSEYLKEESNFWMTKIKEEIKNLSEKQSLKIQYLHDTINTLNSFVSLKYQKDIKILTLVLVGLTIVLVILTAVLIYLTTKNPILFLGILILTPIILNMTPKIFKI